jgi:tetrahydromethanopterin S-methyltransferase subunit B
MDDKSKEIIMGLVESIEALEQVVERMLQRMLPWKDELQEWTSTEESVRLTKAEVLVTHEATYISI